MRLGRRRPPVLAAVPAPPDGAPAGRLGSDRLQAFGHVLAELDGVRAALIAGGDGRQAAAVGLATAAAVAGRRTVLVETDPAEPALAAALGLADAPGLAEYVRGEAAPPEILQPLVLAGPAAGEAVEPLVCVVAGRPGAATGPLADTEPFRQAMARLRGDYELVVVDGSPLEQELALLAAAAQVDAALAWGRRSAVPKGLRGDLDGLIVPLPGATQSS